MFDVFVALCTTDVPRNHPVFMALLYSYCPAAASYWSSNAQVGPNHLPYNVAWQVLNDYSSGADLSNKLEEYGLRENVIRPISTYINKIANFRQRHPFNRAPEIGLEDLMELDKTLRFGDGIQNIWTDHFGGDWRNSFEYARIWVYALAGWIKDIYGPKFGENGEEFVVKVQDIVFRPPKVNFSVRIPAFVFKTDVDGYYKINIGFLAEDAVHNQFRSVLAMMSAPDKDNRWDVEPRIFALDPRMGTAKLFEPIESPDKLIEDMVELGNAVKEGPFPPVAAYADPAKCKVCVFRSQCYGHKNELSDFARQRIAPKNSMKRSIG